MIKKNVATMVVAEEEQMNKHLKPESVALFTEQLLSHKRSKGLTQKALIQATGISKNRVYDIEHEKVENLYLLDLYKICKEVDWNILEAVDALFPGNEKAVEKPKAEESHAFKLNANIKKSTRVSEIFNIGEIEKNKEAVRFSNFLYQILEGIIGRDNFFDDPGNQATGNKRVTGHGEENGEGSCVCSEEESNNDGDSELH